MIRSTGVLPMGGSIGQNRQTQSFDQSVNAPQQVQVSPQSTRKSHFIDWLTFLLPICFLILILLCSINVMNARVDNFKPQGAHNTLTTLKDNLKLAPIEDVKHPQAAAAHSRHSLKDHYLRHLDTSCPTGYTKSSFGQWDGVKEGCLCENGDTSKSLDQCTEQAHCKKVSLENSIQFFKWKTGKEICVKTVQKWKWEPVTCSDTTMSKRCGGICLPTGATQCPLSKLEVVTTGEDLTFGDKKFKKKFEDSAPVVGFTSVAGSESNRMCYNSEHNNKFQSDKSYPLAKVPNDGCGEYNHLVQNNVNLDHQKAKDIHHENDMDSKLNAIPYYSNYIDDTDLYQLELVQRIPIKDDVKCKGVHPDKFEGLQTNAETLESSEYGISVSIFVLTLIGLVIAAVLFLIKDSIFGDLDMRNLSVPKPINLIAIIVAILCIILGAIFISSVSGSDGLNDLSQSLDSYKENECFTNSGINKAIGEYVEYARNTYVYTYAWIITAFVVSIVFLVIILGLVFLQHKLGFKALGNPWRDITQNYSQYE